MTSKIDGPLNPDSIPPISWIVSYPKSGNTWMRYFLYTYLFGVPETMGAVGTKCLALDQLLPEKNRLECFDPKNSAAREALLKKVAKGHAVAKKSWPENTKEYVLMKSHYRYTESHPILGSNDRVILLVRNPKDVLLSSINYLQALDRVEDNQFEEQLRNFIDNGGEKRFTNRGYGSWSGHWKSWIQEGSTNQKVLLVCYEQLLRDPTFIFSQVLDFLDIRPSPTRLNYAVKMTSFQNLRAIEQKAKANSNKFIKREDKFFFNKGTSGRTIKEVYGVDLDGYFDDKFSSQIELFNTLSSRGLVRIAGDANLLAA